MDRGLSRRDFGKLAIGGMAMAGLAGMGGLAGCSSGGSSTSDSKQDVIDRLPDLGIPKPVDYLRTRWAEDPLALCSYSYLAPTVYGTGIRRMLAEPVGRMVFAGEATANIPATVHGAIQAGESAARLASRQLPAGARVIVVGAGAAGLSCAGALAKAGLEPVVIEAADRIGGRVREGDLEGTPVELGASWIHGVNGNPLTDLAEQAGVGLKPFSYESQFPVPGQGPMAAGGERRFNRAINSFAPYAPGAKLQTVDSLLPWRWGPGLEWAVQMEVQQEYGADPGQLAALATWEGPWLGGGDALLDGTYSELFAGLAGDAEIRLGSPVEVIERDSSGVTVKWSDDEVRGDAVVVTVPIGVLKAGTIEFRPALPPGTRKAIEGLGAGLLDKVWLAFEEPFWDEEAEGFGWIDPARPGRWGSWVNAVPVTGKPFLMTLTGGSEARRLERQDDYRLISGTMSALASMFGQTA